MRPKKKILIVDSNEFDQSVIAYLLTTSGYKTFKACACDDAVEIFAEQLIDLVIVTQSAVLDAALIVLNLKQISPSIPMVIMGDPKTMNGVIHTADSVLNKRMTSPSELLERIKIMSVRKRGPRPGHSSSAKLRQSLQVCPA